MPQLMNVCNAAGNHSHASVTEVAENSNKVRKQKLHEKKLLGKEKNELIHFAGGAVAVASSHITASVSYTHLTLPTKRIV